MAAGENFLSKPRSKMMIAKIEMARTSKSVSHRYLSETLNGLDYVDDPLEAGAILGMIVAVCYETQNLTILECISKRHPQFRVLWEGSKSV